MNRSTIIIALVLLSPLSIVIEGQADVLAVLVSSTTTQTVTSYITLTGTGQTTKYVTFKELSSVQIVTGTTYTTKGVITVLVHVLTTALYPVLITTHSVVVTCNSNGQSCIGAAGPVVVTHYVPSTGYVMGYAQSTVYGTVTSQYVTNVPTTLFSTSASTPTYATGQVVSITATQTLTSISEQTGPSISDLLFQNLWILLVLGAVVLAVLALRLGRKGGTGPSEVPPTEQAVQVPKPGTVYCQNCGAQNPATSEFCGKCGTKL